MNNLTYRSPKYIRDELANGKSIEEVCKENQLTFQEVYELMMNLNGRKTPNGTGEPHIVKGDKRFVLRKWGIGYIASFKRLKDAVRVRDELIKQDWDVSQLDDICNWLGIRRLGMSDRRKR